MAHKETILVVDYDEAVCRQVSGYLIDAGYSVEWFTSGNQALAKAKDIVFDLVISGFGLPDIDGLELQQRIRELFPSMGFILMTAQGSIDSAVKALQNGAMDYLTKPIIPEILTISVAQAFETLSLKSENTRIRRVIRSRTQTRSLLGNSPTMIEVYRQVARIADSNANVLIAGETGTGKELIARAIHLNSNRAEHPFVPINCTSIPETLLESELFGHVKGSFTGAIATKKGLFEEAAGGIIFLDEIGDISPTMQVKLLRVLQEKEVRKVGDNTNITVNVRIIAATNKDLETQVKADKFREDLYYRLSVATIHLPSLRERKDDISLLAYYFLDRYAEDENPGVDDISDEVMEIFNLYDWPGNVRELESVIERAVIICKGAELQPADLPERITRSVSVEIDSPDPAGQGLSFKDNGLMISLSELEKNYLLEVLRETNGDKSKAARIMGIGRRTLYRMLDRFELR